MNSAAHTPPIRLVSIVGPTAVGKSRTAVAVAPKIGAEIVSADSMQVYRGMDVGTSKPTLSERLAVVHHLIDVVEPYEDFNAALYKQKALECIEDIVSRGRLPMLVGGSGLYYRAVVDDLDFPPVAAPAREGDVVDSLAEMTDLQLHQQLSRLDPEAASEIPMSNRKRVIRALTVAREGERLISDRQYSWEEFASPYELTAVGLCMDRALLYRLIDIRVERMVENGLKEETVRLREKGLRRGTTAGEALGYRQMLEHLDGRLTFDDAVGEMKKRSRRYARRQLTWFRKDPRISWFMVPWDAGRGVGHLEEALEKTAMLVLEHINDKLEN